MSATQKWSAVKASDDVMDALKRNDAQRFMSGHTLNGTWSILSDHSCHIERYAQ
jgi:hypothetical protein